MRLERITVNDKEFINSYLKKLDGNYSSEYDFVTGFIWTEDNEYFMAEEDGTLFLCNNYSGQTVFAPPVALNSKKDLTGDIIKIKNYCRENNIPFIIRAIDDGMLQRIDKDFLNTINVIYDRSSAEYVYSIKSLIELKDTKHLRDKMNRIIKFEESYNYKFREYNNTDYYKIFDLYDVWMQGANHESSELERNALKIALDNYDAFELRGGVIEIDGEIAAFALAGLMFSGEPQILFEKADTKYYGIYQAVNKYFLEYFYSGYNYINRQEDMGIEGIRRAKMSYEPAFIIEKYRLEDKL